MDTPRSYKSVANEVEHACSVTRHRMSISDGGRAIRSSPTHTIIISSLPMQCSGALAPRIWNIAQSRIAGRRLIPEKLSSPFSAGPSRSGGVNFHD